MSASAVPLSLSALLMRFTALLLGFTFTARAAETPKIPLQPGLTIVTAVRATDGDYESIKVIESADAISLRMRYSSESSRDEGIDTESNQYQQCRPHPTDPIMVLCQITVDHTVLRSDLRSSDHYLPYFGPPSDIAETVPGTTAIGTSTAVLNALKTLGSVDFTTYIGATVLITSADSTADSIMDPRERGTLRRVESAAVPIPVIVNNRLVSLPAIHAKGTLGIDESEFFFLDDPDNPLTLRFTIGNEKLTVIRINTPSDGVNPDSGGGGGGAGAGAGGGGGKGSAAGGGASGAGNAGEIEQSLSSTGHADVYGIYFSYNSDIIRPESEPVLREIATLLAKHPDWKLNVDGHTDNIGGAAFNQTLSTRRASAVKKTLVERYHIAAARLDTAGYGLTRPKAPNDTLEGRALNRRVELVRQ